MKYITFDIETYSPSKQDKIDTKEFRCSVCGAYFSWIDEYVAFLEEDLKIFLDLLKEAELVIGYNHIAFDLSVLQKYASWDLLKLPNYDIMSAIHAVLGIRLRLNDLCKANLTDDLKTDSYENFKHYYWNQEWGKLIDYCMNDVRLTEEIFRKILKSGKLNYFDLHQQKEVLLEKPKAKKVKIVAQPDAIF